MRASYVQALLALLASSRIIAAESDKIIIRLPPRMPTWVEKLSPNLAGFSIEMDRWPDWAGPEVGKPNEYFNQILRNLGERTGHMPYLRVGANSQDRATLDLNIQVMNATFPEPSETVPNPEADHIFIGQDFYALSANLPAGTPFMWGLNFKSFNKTETVAQARLLADTFQGSRANLTSHVRLMDVEIGNEPDFYGPNRRFTRQGVLGPDWDMYNYTDTWSEYARAISKEIDFDPGSGKPGLSPGAYTGHNYPEWTVEGTLMGGLLDDPELVSKFSQFTVHAYSGSFNPQIPVATGQLMDKDTIHTNLTSKIGSGHPAEAVRSTGLKYILAETNSYSNHGFPGLSNSVESAVWAVNWLLLSATSGIERLHFHHGIGFRYNIVQPIASSEDGLNLTIPHILPSYHAFLIVNEAIGTSGNAYVAEVPTPNVNVTAYGIWEDCQLERLVVLNSQVYLGWGEKPSIDIQLDSLPGDGTAKIKLLRSEKTNSHIGLTWAGQSFETESGIPEGEAEEDDVNGGSFSLPASSVALLDFGNM